MLILRLIVCLGLALAADPASAHSVDSEASQEAAGEAIPADPQIQTTGPVSEPPTNSVTVVGQPLEGLYVSSLGFVSLYDEGHDVMYVVADGQDVYVRVTGQASIAVTVGGKWQPVRWPHVFLRRGQKCAIVGFSQGETFAVSGIQSERLFPHLLYPDPKDPRIQ